MDAQKPVILVVDDDDANRYALARALREAEFEVVEATDGVSALVKAADRPDLIILDVRLPDLDGMEVCHRIKTDPALRSIPVLHLSAHHTSSHDKADGLNCGADAYLVRPLEAIELIATVNALLQLKKSEERLAQSESQYQQIIENLPDYAIFTIDPKGFVTTWQRGAERVKGWRRDEIIGKHLATFYTPEQIAAGLVEQELEEAGREGRAEREDWRVRKGGQRFWGNEIMTAIHGAGGTLLGFTKITRDLSDRKQMEDALRENEERNRAIVENARDYAIFMTDPQGRIITWNTGAQRIFGYEDAEIIGYDASLLFTPEDRAAGAQQQELAAAAAEGHASDDRWQIRKGGERFFASGITTPLRDSSGLLRGFVKICRDLTEQHTLQTQRERLLAQEQVARLQAERAATMRDEFLAIVSHELRTPLTAILLWANMLRSGGVPPEDVPEALESILMSAQAQQQLIGDLLDMSRMILGKLRLDLREMSLGAVVRDAIDAVRPMALTREVEIDSALDDNAGRVLADPDRIRQVVWNLLQNAVKFSDRGGRVTVRLRRAEDSLEIQVQDLGRGIPAEFLPHVFDRFRQADPTSTRDTGGLGLGLSICRQLVSLHGGTIRALSAGQGKGSTFSVTLPLVSSRRKPAHDGTAIEAPFDGEVFEPSGVLNGMRILLVEDQRDARMALQRVLEMAHADVTAVDCAALAIAAFRDSLLHRRYDLLISDIGMPVQDGYELLNELRELERQRAEQRPIPAIALSAYAREEDRTKSASAGFQLHVTKPITPAALISAVAGLKK